MSPSGGSGVSQNRWPRASCRSSNNLAHCCSNYVASLSAGVRELALRRFELLRPYLDGLLSLRSVVKDPGIPYRTAARWVAGYRKDDRAALARKGRSDEGARRLATERMFQAIKRLALGVWTRGLMVQSIPKRGWRHYGAGFTPERHNN